MVHPMFELEACLAKYPVFGTALEETFPEIEELLFWQIGEMPLIGLPKAILEAVDRHIDGSHSEKQALMIGALYLLAPQLRRAGNYPPDYDARTVSTIREITAGENAGSPYPEAAARASAVVSTYLMQTQEFPPGALSPADIAVFRDGQRDAERLFLPHLNAPRLESAYLAAKQELLARMQAACPPSPDNASGGHGPAPSP